jgi:hypothetical protein
MDGKREKGKEKREGERKDTYGMEKERKKIPSVEERGAGIATGVGVVDTGGKLPPVSLILGRRQLYTGVVDTSDKFATGVQCKSQDRCDHRCR